MSDRIWFTGVLRDFGQFAALKSGETEDEYTIEHLTMVRVQPDDQGQATAIFIPYPLIKAEFVQPEYTVRRDDILLQSECSPIMQAKLSQIWDLPSPIAVATRMPPSLGG